MMLQTCNCQLFITSLLSFCVLLSSAFVVVHKTPAISTTEKQQPTQVPFFCRTAASGSSSTAQYSVRRRKKNFDSAEDEYHPLKGKVSNSEIRFLGKGPDAVVRPGVVMLAPSHEYHTFHRQAAIFVYAMGLDDDDTYVIRGVILDNPTPFTLAEMTDNHRLLAADLSKNILFRGGGDGSDSAMLLHNQEHVGDGTMIGKSGIYQGGLETACNLVDITATASPAAGGSDKSGSSSSFRDNFKFFFNYCEFTENELERMFNEDVDSNGDAWISVEVPPDVVLADWNKGDAWIRLRNAVKHNWK